MDRATLLRPSAAGQVFCSCKTCTSTVRGGRMRMPSPHGRVHGMSQQGSSGSCRLYTVVLGIYTVTEA